MQRCRNMTTDTDTKTYNPEEVKAMEELGYITPRRAAEEAGMRIDHVYRATKARKVRGKTVKGIRVKLGANAWNRYVHRGDWMALVEEKRAHARESLGL